MNKHATILIVLLCIVAAGGFFVLVKKSEAPSTTENTPTAATKSQVAPTSAPASTAAPAATVTYTATGFEPNTITISKGDTVRFVNNSGRGMWVASNIHPTHTEYPIKSPGDCLGSSFDECQAVADGESWDFEFDAVGSFNYHNHVRARDTGTVVVNE